MNFVLKRGNVEIKTNIHKIKRYKPRMENQLEEEEDQDDVHNNMEVESIQPSEPDLRYEVTPQANNNNNQL